MTDGKDKERRKHLQAVGDQSRQMTLYDPVLNGQVDDEEGIDLRELWRVVIKRKWTIAGVTAIVVTAALLSSLLMVPEYRSTTTIEINPSAQILNIRDFEPQYGGWRGEDLFMNSQQRILGSRALAEEVVRAEDVADHPELSGEVRQRSVRGELRSLLRTVRQAITPGSGSASNSSGNPSSREHDPAPAAAGRLRNRIEVEPIRDSRLVNIRVTGFDPEFAARMANGLAEQYIKTSLQRRYDAGNEAREFLEGQLEDMRIALERSDQALNDFARDRNVADLDQRIELAKVAMNRFSQRHDEIQGELVKLASWRELIDQGRIDHLDPVVESSVLRSLNERLVEANSELVSLSERFREGYPAMTEARSRISRLEQEIADEKERIVGNIIGRHENLEAQAEALREAITEREQRILALNEQAVQYNILRREFQTNQELYDGLLQRMKEIGVVAGIQENNISLIERAQVAGAPFNPNIPRNLAMALMIGLMGGLGLALLLEFLDSSIRRVEDIERLVDRPVLGMVPIVKLRSKERAKKERGKSEERSKDAERAVSHYSAVHPKSAVSEAFRSLRTSLMFSTPEGMPRTLMVTSAGTAEGKTTTAINLATVLAQNGARVLLIDSDLRKPRVHRDFNCFRAPGLTNRIALSENTGRDNSAIHPTHVENLFIMPSGNSTPSPAELLSSDRLARILDSCGRAFDHVILDSPPTLGLADAMILSRQVDGVVLVTRAGITAKDNFRVAIKRLSQVKAPVLGVVLNGFDLDSPEYAYYSSYYYNYEGEDEEDAQVAGRLGTSAS